MCTQTSNGRYITVLTSLWGWLIANRRIYNKFHTAGCTFRIARDRTVVIHLRGIEVGQIEADRRPTLFRFRHHDDTVRCC